MEHKQNSDLTALKTVMKAADNVGIPLDETYYELLHDKIMAATEKTKVAPPPLYANSCRYWRAHWKDCFYPAGGVLSVFFIMVFFSGQLTQFNQVIQRAGLFSDGLERIAIEAANSPEDFTQTLINM